MMRFICFGSGSSGNCYYLYTENTGLLIDSGIGIRAMKKYFRDRELPFRHISHILVTHDHADHVKSVGAVSSELGVQVHATEGVHLGIYQNYVVRAKVATQNIRIIEKNEEYVFGDFVVRAFSVPHDSRDNVGYSVKCGDVTFVLMTDVGYVTDEMKGYISDANYLVIEANHDKEMLRTGHYPDFLKTRVAGPTGHLSNAECAEAIAENCTEKLRHVWLCHLSEENNHPELARKTVQTVLARYGIIADKDFRVEVLKRRTPSQNYELKI